jgi:arabinose-5-phosphate isomerase
MHVADIMRKGKNNPIVKESALVKEALFVMTDTGVGATSIVNKSGKLTGFFTDGDLRRRLQNDDLFLTKSILQVMTKSPRTVSPDMMAVEAASILKKHKIDNIPVVDKNNKPIGILEQGDLLAEGIS